MRQVCGVLVLLLGLLATGEAIKCYTCTGYSSNFPENSMTNNPHCPDLNFDASLVHVSDWDSPLLHEVCSTISATVGGVEVTFRGTLVDAFPDGCSVTSVTIMGVDVNGSLCTCKEDLCNAP
ncbi:uncharacterized protein LOC143027202 [Oratosquilla oratoria]|uniref:uncharacterized protein LOC143027202 n=1 Tax=Oratosquilla oratoria TaxID=337810 RepID=UPI003F75906E